MFTAGLIYEFMEVHEVETREGEARHTRRVN